MEFGPGLQPMTDEALLRQKELSVEVFEADVPQACHPLAELWLRQVDRAIRVRL